MANAKTQDQPKPTPWWVIGTVIGGWIAAVGFIAWRAKKSGEFDGRFDELDGARRWREQLPGGRAAGRRPAQFDPVQLRRGMRVEMEHTRDPNIAMEIAMDHLIEDPRYYHKLALIHQD